MSYTGSHTQKSEKRAKRREKLSSFFYDMSKIIMGGTVITFLPSVVIDGVEFDGFVLYTISIGFSTVVILALIADRIMKY